MIERLNHRDINVASTIYSVFQLSYQVEAEILGAKDFPPLHRPIDAFVNSETQFFGYIRDSELAGVIEIEYLDNYVDINSLVVHPQFFRQGVGRKLVEFVFQSFESPLFVVETGVDNEPATTLYKKLGFQEVKQWDTEFGIRKVKFERRL